MFKYIEVGPYYGEQDLERMLNDVIKSRELRSYRLVQFWVEEFVHQESGVHAYVKKTLHTLWQLNIQP